MVCSPFLQEGLIVYGLKKESRWSSRLGASVAMKIGKNRLESKKSYTLQSREDCFYEKILNHLAHGLFLHLSKNL
jgi:hypothetical protein